MISALVTGLVLLAPPAQAKAPPIRSTNGHWVPATLSAEALANQVDARLATLTKATLRYYYTFDQASASGTPFAWCDATIVGPTQFWIQLPHFVPTQKREPFSYETWVADGKRFGAAVAKDPVPGPMASRPGVPAKVMAVWFKDFSRVILAGIGQPVHPLARMVADARKEGFKIATESRSLPMKARLYTFHRIVATKGPIRYEVVIDGRGLLPVSVINTIGRDSSRWSAVDWNTRPGKAFNPRNARFMKPGETRDISPAPRRS